MPYVSLPIRPPRSGDAQDSARYIRERDAEKRFADAIGMINTAIMMACSAGLVAVVTGMTVLAIMY